MPDIYDRETRSRVMRRVRSQGTGPETAVRRALHRMGYRFRLQREDLPGTPDIVVPRYRTAIFVHGCFWHSHPGCPHADRPSSHTDYWEPKLDRNVARDQAVSKALRDQGWQVAVVWECEARDPVMAEVALRKLLPSRDSGLSRDATDRPADSIDARSTASNQRGNPEPDK